MKRSGAALFTFSLLNFSKKRGEVNLTGAIYFMKFSIETSEADFIGTNP